MEVFDLAQLAVEFFEGVFGREGIDLSLSGSIHRASRLESLGFGEERICTHLYLPAFLTTAPIAAETCQRTLQFGDRE